MTPPGTRHAEPAPLSRWEILGAWLHFWTPRRGGDVPPVPWRKVALWGALVAIVVGVAAAIAVPQIDDAKQKGAAQRAREKAAADAREIARLRKDQSVHTLVVPNGIALVGALEDAITQDAKARAATGTLDGPVYGTSCSAASTNIVQFAGSRVYKCFVATSKEFRGEGTDILKAGYAFVATVYPDKRRISWCKQNPHADEKGSRGQYRVPVSPVCAGKLSKILG